MRSITRARLTCACAAAVALTPAGLVFHPGDPLKCFNALRQLGGDPRTPVDRYAITEDAQLPVHAPSHQQRIVAPAGIGTKDDRFNP
jgi:hypothetical protein